MEPANLTSTHRTPDGDEMFRLFDKTTRLIKYLMPFACFQYLFCIALLGLL